MRKICIIDSYSWKHFHEIFNASFLAECISIVNEVMYFSGSSTLKSLIHIMGSKDLGKVTFRNIPVINGHKKIHILLRFLLSAIINCWLLIKIDKDNIIIYNYNNVFSLPLIIFLNKLFNKKIAIVCHGEFEIFNQSFYREFTLFWRLCYGILKKYFTNKNAKITTSIIFLVLGDNIRDNLSVYITNLFSKRFYSIDHSYISKIFNQKERDNNAIIKMGMIGQVRKGKNISDVILLAQNLSSEISNGRIELSIVGSVAIMSEELRSAGINISEGNNFISRDEYDKKIDSLDYILFFYNKDMYKYTASGPLMDALFMGKPIIALRNNYFEYMFRKYGEFGKLVDSIDDMAVLIRELINGKKLPIFNFKNIQDQLRPEKIALQLQKAFNGADYL
jgi:hypothetical protein